MTLGEIVDVIDKEEKLLVSFWDPNMNMQRDISHDNLSTFIRSNGHIRVKQIIPGSYNLTVIIDKP